MSTNDRSEARLSVVLTGVSAADAAGTQARWTTRGYAVVRVAAGADIDATLKQVQVALDALRGAGGRVAVVGYGDGGRYAFLAVTRLGADGAAAFRGIGIGAHLDEARLARVPVSLHFGDDDPRVPPAEVRAIKGALEGIGAIDIYRYAQWDAAAETQAEARAFTALEGVRTSLR